MIETKATYTPGPWQSDGKILDWLSGEAPAVAVFGPPDANFAMQPVCMVAPHLSGKYGVAGSLNPIEDARLIAAAPELLAACKAALGAFERNDAIDWNDLSRAIAKAEGSDE